MNISIKSERVGFSPIYYIHADEHVFDFSIEMLQDLYFAFVPNIMADRMRMSSGLSVEEGTTTAMSEYKLLTMMDVCLVLNFEDSKEVWGAIIVELQSSINLRQSSDNNFTIEDYNKILACAEENELIKILLEESSKETNS